MDLNDLSVADIFNMWKYVDDTTVFETIQIGQQSKDNRWLIMSVNGPKRIFPTQLWEDERTLFQLFSSDLR